MFDHTRTGYTNTMYTLCASCLIRHTILYTILVWHGETARLLFTPTNFTYMLDRIDTYSRYSHILRGVAVIATAATPSLAPTHAIGFRSARRAALPAAQPPIARLTVPLTVSGPRVLCAGPLSDHRHTGILVGRRASG